MATEDDAHEAEDERPAKGRLEDRALQVQKPEAGTAEHGLGKMLRRLVASIFVVALAVVATIGLRELFAPPPPSSKVPVAIEVRDGDSFSSVANELERQGLIRSALVFRAVAKLRGERVLRTGIYDFAAPTTPLEALQHIERGPDRNPLVVVPEGLTVTEIAAIFAERGLVDPARFRALALDPKFTRSLGVPADRLEGYLFPDSYSFSVKMTEEQILERMVKQFFTAFGDDLRSVAAARGMSMHEAVTLASLIEKEAKIDTERSLISAVFHNRLARGMRLESDPTAVYDLPDHSGPVRAEDLRRPSPFNTYQIRGLPPGPIANPGRASLLAAVRPAADVKALYFVAGDDGSHVFSETLRAHTQAIDRLRRQTNTAANS